MRFSYKFSQLLGTVYRKGNITFTANGDSVVAPVGNKISVYDLKNNKSETLPIESRYNYVAIALSPTGTVLIAINEDGEADLISLISKTVIHKFRFNRPVVCVKFSPNGKFFALTKENAVFVYLSPGVSRDYNPFVLERTFHASFDHTTSIDWSSDSRILLVGSKDMSVRLYPMEKFESFRNYALGGHTDIIVGCFFENDSLDAYTVARNGHVSVWECCMNLEDLKKQEGKLNLKVFMCKTLFAYISHLVSSDKKKEDPEEEDEISENKDEPSNKKEEKSEENTKFFYKRLSRHYLFDTFKGEKGHSIFNISLTSAAYHSSTKLLVTGYSHGAFLLHEMPEVNLIHSLKISDQEISSIAINNTGDWIALGCAGLGQLLVWEWQSETYVMKQQGHFDSMSAVAYSPDGSFMATGGQDSKVKGITSKNFSNISR